MKYGLKINEEEYLFSESELALIISAMSKSEILTQMHVGHGKGTTGYNNAYIPAIEPGSGKSGPKVTAMSEEAYEAIKFISSQQKEN